MLNEKIRKPQNFIANLGIVILCMTFTWFMVFRIHPLFYGVMFFVILWVQLRMFIYGHESLHHFVFETPIFNTFVGRVFCFFPIFISFNKYQKYHQLHHKYVGTELDPDFILYNPEETNWKSYLKRSLLDAMSLRAFAFGIKAYTDIIPGSKSKLNYEPDSLLLVSFWVVFVSFFYQCGLLKEFFILWFFPLVFFPVVLSIYTLIHHGDKSTVVINIDNAKPWHNIIFPLNINLHGSHHQVPNSPWFLLKYEQAIEKRSPMRILKEMFH